MILAEASGAVLTIFLTILILCSAQEKVDDWTMEVSRQLDEVDNPLEEYWKPPLPGARANPVNVSFIVMDVEFLDEKKGLLSAFIDMELSWRDARYSQRCEQIIRAECDALTLLPEDSEKEKKKKLRQFNKTGCHDVSNVGVPKMMSKFQREYGRWQVAVLNRLSVPVEDGVVAWTPVPERLRSGVEDRRTKGDVILGFPCSGEERGKDPSCQQGRELDSVGAVLSDGKSTKFPIDFTYQSFPFDMQELNLCITFERPVAPSLKKPRNVEAFDERSTNDYKPLDASRNFNQRALDSLRIKGWRVQEDIQYVMRQHYAVSEVCVVVKVTRSRTQIVMRLFIPLFLLLFTPFFGFWLPVTQVMPRIATGFISFLSMQVFRSVAYAMMPRQPTSLVWLDVMLTVSTEMMFLSVLHNMAAVVCQARVSSIAASNFDRQARVIYPATNLLIIIILMALGEHRVDVNTIMGIVQSLVALMVMMMTLHQIWYLRKLPEHIIHHLIHDIISGTVTSHETQKLDSRELSYIFHLIDVDRSGSVTADEILTVFQKFGWNLSEDEWNRQKRYLEDAVGLKSEQRSIYFDDFAKHFLTIFGQSASRRMTRLPTPAKIERVEDSSKV
eukprot:gnl/MRDRNA2_/MRDRNA2_85470_c0_seq1.p1 gnl/MRDRNA2_/MRDRNA2_85470_c0~~gnl/MRDRNA2_/MRDRNA2_85470_c0_seq1.p1  ORF type:complete len:614 (+),score=97.63 gnl/MRDRNA2_/MRDRNA2_85470_c0_seq1:52-1893(+)